VADSSPDKAVTSSLPQTFAFDPEAVREKYRGERDKRLRPEGNRQFPEIAGDRSRYLDDPQSDPTFVRDPIADEVDVVIIGGGLGGLLAGANLRANGVKRIRVIEKGSDFGGVWYWNRYPGAQCDIESYIYLPLLEELGYMPKEKYSFAPEIRQYCGSIGRHYDLYADVCFQTEVTEVRWREECSRWDISTDRGDCIRAHFVVMAPGSQHRPRLPAIPGIDDFRGHTFHTSRWDYGYTRGDPNGNMTGLADKRVGLIGTGATAVQCVPYIAESAQHLFVFQRTPSTVAERNNRPTDPEWARSLTPGWQSRRMRNFITLMTSGTQDEDLVADGWTHAVKELGVRPVARPTEKQSDDRATAAELADFQLMEQIRGRVSAIVKDPETAERLKPYYRYMCKRPGFHDTYLQSFNRSNVTLVDTHGLGVQRVTKTGVVVDEREYEIDCLIFATGFDVGSGYLRSAGYEVIGKGALRLSELWSAGTKTFHGFLTHGFPNCFFMGDTNTGVTANFVYTLAEQASHVAYLVAACQQTGADQVETTREAEDDWGRIIHGTSNEGMVEFRRACTPGYFNNEGQPGDPNGLLSGRYPGGALEFFELLRQWRDEGAFRGLEFMNSNRHKTHEFEDAARSHSRAQA
jgi:cation diffusion facilitator CzcD-associated flavoprotein CzcO